jgi:integrase
MGRLHRLTERQCANSMPLETVIPAPGVAAGAGHYKVSIAEGEQVIIDPTSLRRRPDGSTSLTLEKASHTAIEEVPFGLDKGRREYDDIIKGDDRGATVLARKKLAKALKTLHDPTLTARDGKPVMIRRRTRWLCDGLGLWLVVSPGDNPDTVRRSWIFRWTVPGETVVSRNGKVRRVQRRMGLGSLLTTDLKRARERAAEMRRLIQDGLDPLTVKRGRAAEQKVAERSLKTLANAVDDYLIAHRDGWRSRRHALNWKNSFRHVMPVLGDLPVQSLTTPLIVQALTPVWKAHPETGRRLRGRLERVIDQATANGWRTGENPCRWRGLLEFSFDKRQKLMPVRHMSALSYARVADFVAKVRVVDSVEARALELMILTATRTSEVIHSQGDEFDLDAEAWSIPAARSKTGKTHVVPLSAAAVACLRKVEPRPGQPMFPGVGDHSMLRLVKRIRKGITAHGFRSCFRTWAAECTDFPSEIAESCLAHTIGSAVERAYRRTTFMEKRKILMQTWSDYCDGRADSGENVIPMAGRRA